jgi:hypothetical protein
MVPELQRSFASLRMTDLIEVSIREKLAWSTSAGVEHSACVEHFWRALLKKRERFKGSLENFG